MRWASAGHDAPMVYDPAADRFQTLNGSDLSLGLKKKVQYEERLFSDVKPGQIYLASTDGLWEAFNARGEMFGKERVRKVIRCIADLSAKEICDQINAELSNFLGDANPDDDVSFVIVKVT